MVFRTSTPHEVQWFLQGSRGCFLMRAGLTFPSAKWGLVSHGSPQREGEWCSCDWYIGINWLIIMAESWDPRLHFAWIRNSDRNQWWMAALPLAQLALSRCMGHTVQQQRKNSPEFQETPLPLCSLCVRTPEHLSHMTRGPQSCNESLFPSLASWSWSSWGQGLCFTNPGILSTYFSTWHSAQVLRICLEHVWAPPDASPGGGEACGAATGTIE